MWKLTENKDWDSLRKQFKWVNDMHGVQQDPIYHAEGDVATHTLLVCSETLSSIQLNNQDKEILWTSALMHDIEKRSTTIIDPETKRITSPGHAKKGEYTARTILYKDVVTPFEIREQIAKLVRYHGYPIWFSDKENIEKSLVKTSLEVKISALVLLTVADVMGRTCPPQDQLTMLDSIELLADEAETYDCLNNNYHFVTPTQRFEYFRKDDRNLNYVPHDMYINNVYMMSGLPGAGKDTYIRNSFDLPILSLDDIRIKMKIKPDDKKGNGQVIQAAKEQAKEYLRKYQSFIFNATNITQSMRKIWIDLFSDYRAKTHIKYLEVPYKTLLEQNKSREEQVPSKVIDKLINKMEIPQQWEAHTVEYIV